MQYDAKTPAQYLDLLDDDWRKGTLLELRSLLMELEPELEESVHYRMLGYGRGEDFVFHLNAQKGYVSLYCGNASKIDPDGVLLAGLNVGKGCIRFSKSRRVADTCIGEFIRRAVRRWKAGEDVGC